MLSFEIIRKGKAVQICCDDEGLNRLIGALEKLRGTATHIHLRSPAGGGNELSEKNPWGPMAISEVIITTGGD